MEGPRGRRGILALMAAAVALGVFTLSPVSAHFTQDTKHLGKHAWAQFIKKKADARYVGRLWAIVDDDGTIVRGRGSTGTDQVGPGFYRVRFNRNVRKCSVQATQGAPRVTEEAPVGGEATVGWDFTKKRGVFVGTTDSDGTAGDFAFHVAVLC